MKSSKTCKVKEVSENSDFADIIYRLRTKRDLTQKSLADKIQVSDRTISKWENGQTIPDLINIRNICDELGVSPSSLIHNKPTAKDIFTSIKIKLLNALNYILKNIFSVLFIIVFILLLIFFINNYNSISIYKLKYDSENINIEHGYFMKSDTTNILIIDNINVVKIDYKEKNVKLELYTYVEGDKHVLYASNNLDDIFIEEQSKYPNVLTAYAINGIMKNMYMDITIVDNKNKEHIYSTVISLKDKVSNDKLAYKTIHKDINYNNKDISSYGNNKFLIIDNLSNSINRFITMGYEYDETNKIYSKVDKHGGKIEYCLVNKIVKYSIVIDGINIVISFDSKENLEFNVLVNNKFEKISCEVKNNKNETCKKYENEIKRTIDIFKELQ